MGRTGYFLMLALAVLLAANLVTGTVAPSQVGLTRTPMIPGERWRVHDPERPLPPVVTPAYDGRPVPPPDDAVVLFDGTHLDHFTNSDLEIENGAMVMGRGGQETLAPWGDLQLHVEWATPVPARGEGQDRGNSGIKLMGLYEIQVLDSHDNPTYADAMAGALYGQQPPLVNASREPGQWQTYDIFFQAPRFNADESLKEPARVTVIHNGVLVQLHQPFRGPTKWRANTTYRYHADKLPLVLQWHRSPVRYRNIWLRPLMD
jgi:hypothetical protein